MDAVSVTAAAGFSASGCSAGIKPDHQLDFALVRSTSGPVPAAAVFTQCQTEAAPVTLSRQHIGDGRAAAVVLNSGCANAGTGAEGAHAALAIAQAVADAVGEVVGDVLVCSTGPIGTPLPRGLANHVPELVAGLGVDGMPAALAILTTDSIPKQATAAGTGWVVGGMAKGAGMIRPDMATMLAVLTTDAEVDATTLREVLGEAVDPTFNSLNIDGCQSTNDAVILMASGASGIVPNRDEFAAAVTAVCKELAMAMAGDAEGASRLVMLIVSGADSNETARRLGKAVADSALVRSSFYGGDANWGRVYGALGVAGVPLEPSTISVAYQKTPVAIGGVAVPFDVDSLRTKMGEERLVVDIEVGVGPGRAEIVTTDLTPQYVVFNGEPS